MEPEEKGQPTAICLLNLNERGSAEVMNCGGNIARSGLDEGIYLEIGSKSLIFSFLLPILFLEKATQDAEGSLHSLWRSMCRYPI